MAYLNVGKGVYIWQPGTIERGVPDAIAARLKLAGVQTATIKICDGFKVLGGLQPLFQTLRNHGIRVGAWGYSYLNRAPLQEARIIAEACNRYAPDFYLLDVETEVEGNFGGARMFLNELLPAVRGLPLGLNSFWNVRLHPTFPWADFMKVVDFVCPQVYGHGADPVAKLIESQQAYTEVPNAPHVPMPVVAGDMHTFRGMRPTPEQVIQFLSAADGDPFIQGVIMWAADGTQTTPDLWQAFSRFEWKNGGRTIPAQPMGWAKVKIGGGLWIRSSPQGAKVAGLAKGELAPIWALTDTRWGALTQAADQWIFLGNRDNVDTTLDLSGEALPPPTGLELYEARVAPRRGLNVRDAIGGRVLRALPVNTSVRVYEEKDGWARINPAKTEWVSAAFLSRLTA
ncbi:MAG: hypothetical protein V1755_09055 [Chloroflexota bacterium]